MGCSPWGPHESDTTERLHFHFSLSCIGEGNGNPLQCSCLENPRDGGAWWAAVYGVAQSRTRLKWLSSSMLLLCLKFFSGLPPHLELNPNASPDPTWSGPRLLLKTQLLSYHSFPSFCFSSPSVLPSDTLTCPHISASGPLHVLFLLVPLSSLLAGWFFFEKQLSDFKFNVTSLWSHDYRSSYPYASCYSEF